MGNFQSEERRQSNQGFEPGLNLLGKQPIDLSPFITGLITLFFTKNPYVLGSHENGFYLQGIFDINYPLNSVNLKKLRHEPKIDELDPRIIL